MAFSSNYPSKMLVKCGVCNFEMRRDDMKASHFPKCHPGIKYKEKGERDIQNLFTFKKAKSSDKIDNDIFKHRMMIFFYDQLVHFQTTSKNKEEEADTNK